MSATGQLCWLEIVPGEIVIPLERTLQPIKPQPGDFHVGWHPPNAFPGFCWITGGMIFTCWHSQRTKSMWEAVASVGLRCSSEMIAGHPWVPDTDGANCSVLKYLCACVYMCVHLCTHVFACVSLGLLNNVGLLKMTFWEPMTTAPNWGPGSLAGPYIRSWSAIPKLVPIARPFSCLTIVFLISAFN